jgi:pimeloyl-ACP methyl ester carboxylesterase
VQRALNALSKSKFFADLSQNFMIGDLKQVVAYLGNPEIHEAAIKTVLDRLTDDTRVVVGHSLGSVVAYEALCRQPAKVVSFVTVGSPLGIRNVIFDRLTPPPNEAGLGKWPGKVLYWTNIADAGDIVAMQRELKPRFGSQVKDLVIYNGSDAHHGERYLTTREAGEAIRAAL